MKEQFLDEVVNIVAKGEIDLRSAASEGIRKCLNVCTGGYSEALLIATELQIPNCRKNKNKSNFKKISVIFGIGAFRQYTILRLLSKSRIKAATTVHMCIICQNRVLIGYNLAFQ